MFLEMFSTSLNPKQARGPIANENRPEIKKNYLPSFGQLKARRKMLKPTTKSLIFDQGIHIWHQTASRDHFQLL